MNICGAVINPSLIEGASPVMISIIASGGLLPITAERCGVAFNIDFLTVDINPNAFIVILK